MTRQLESICPNWTYFERKPAFLWDPCEDCTKEIVIPDQIGTNWQNDSKIRFPIVLGDTTLLAELIMDRAEHQQWVDGNGECYVIDSTELGACEGPVVSIDNRYDMCDAFQEFAVYAGNQGSLHGHRYGLAMIKQAGSLLLSVDPDPL
ncbi:MAG: hypothetical protein HQL78_14245 [Magnetococcales bacterium]|nr:hypothetical protein [Magnetococcales bacterium]